MDLVALEEIRRLKYRYLRCVDRKLWDEFSQTFTADATAAYGTPVEGEPVVLNGRDEITAFMRRRLGPDVVTAHLCGQPEIDVDGDEAVGTWAFQDTVIIAKYDVVIIGHAFYDDRYRRENGVWRISHTGYERRTYEAQLSLKDLPSFKLTS